MKTDSVLAKLTFCFLLVVTHSQSTAATPIQSPEKPLPDFGVIFNIDGGITFNSLDPETAARRIEYHIDTAAGKPLRTLAYCVCSTSDLLHYPSKVGVHWGWRETSMDSHPFFNFRLRSGKALNIAGFDGPRVAGERAKKLGLYFFPSYRMNDGHFVNIDPFNNPTTGAFWVQNPHLRIGANGESPLKSNPNYANLLDYSHEEVRQHRLEVIYEIIDRYQDIMDGIELDFTRSFYYFPFNEGFHKGHLITDLVEKVRERLDSVGEKNGRKYYLMTRIASSLKRCNWIGLDIKSWMEKRLVDVLVPSPRMGTSFDMQIEEFIKLGHEANCAVYPSLNQTMGWAFPFSENPSIDTYASKPANRITPELMRAAAANYWALGVNGMYTFNMSTGDPQLLSYFSSPASLNRQSKVYRITHGYYQDREEPEIYDRQLSAELKGNKTYDFKLLIGEDFNNPSTAMDLRYTGLRLGFRKLQPDQKLRVSINGEEISFGPAKDHLTVISDRRLESSVSIIAESAITPPAQEFWQMKIDDPSVFHQGRNIISINLDEIKEAPYPVLTDVEVGVFYNTKWRITSGPHLYKEHVAPKTIPKH